MYLIVLQKCVEEKTGVAFDGFWTPVMPSPPVACADMQRSVGVMKQW
jgi:hypothetical protein